MAKPTIYSANILLGGGDGALDSIDGNLLLEGDGAIVIADGTTYTYWLDDDSGVDESSPDVIKPDTNAGTKRWILQNVSTDMSFTDLIDVDEVSIDSADIGKVVKVGPDLKLEFAEDEGGGTFVELSDTPANYTDQAGKYVKVNAGEDALEFDTPAGGGFGRPIILTPQSSCGPSTNFATHDTIAGGSTPPEEVSVLDFDPDASEYRDFKFALPSGYDGGGLDITIYYSMTSDHDEGTPHKVRWEVAIRRINDDAEDINGAHAYQYNGVSDTVPSEIGEISVAHILFSDGADMDSLAASEMAILRIYRDHDHADDTGTGDAELQMITIKEN